MTKVSYLITLVLVFIFLGNAFAQKEEGSISSEMLDDFRSSVEKQKELKALQNAISNNSLKDLALNRENVGKLDHYFKYTVKTEGITDQKSSGRCWLFTGLNVFRPIVIEKYNLDNFEFSQTYSFFYDQLEKANLFLEGIIATADMPLNDERVKWFLKSPIGDGGQWTTFADNVKKYGLVPKSAMPETKNSESTGMMSRLIRRKLKGDAMDLRQMHKDGVKLKKLRKHKEEILADVYKMLVLTLGEPPREFTWRYKDKDGNISEPMRYTPLSFYKEAVGVDVDQYVMFMNDPTREYFKLYEVEYDRSIKEGFNWRYINLPNEEIKEFAMASIRDNEGMYFSCDVGKQLNGEEGTLDVNNYAYGDLLQVDFDMNKTERIQTFESASTHGMALMGYDPGEDGKADKWLLENSWGADAGHKGYLTMTDEWFDEYMFRLIIKQKYISEEVLEILEQEPIMLPPWDPMFTPEP